MLLAELKLTFGSLNYDNRPYFSVCYVFGTPHAWIFSYQTRIVVCKAEEAWMLDLIEYHIFPRTQAHIVSHFWKIPADARLLPVALWPTASSTVNTTQNTRHQLAD